jgi:hypothetical protein
MLLGTNRSQLEGCTLRRTSHVSFLGVVSTDVTLTCHLFIKYTYPNTRESQLFHFLMYSFTFLLYMGVLVHPTVERLTLGPFFAMLIMQEEFCEKVCASLSHMS